MSAEEDRGGEGADRPGAYVHRVAWGTLRYAEELTAENHTLRRLLAALYSERRGFVSGMHRVREEREEHAELYRATEHKKARMDDLYAASYCLHSTLDPQEVLATILDIVRKLAGCKESAVFEMGDGGTALRLTAWAGIEPAVYREVAFATGLIGQCARTGEVFIAADADPVAPGEGEAAPSACVPLLVEGRVCGVIALFGLPSGKTGIDTIDRELFDLLGTHASTALYCARLHARTTAGRS